MTPDQLQAVPGFLFFDHVAIAVNLGELEAHVNTYRALGFAEVHREDVLGIGSGSRGAAAGRRGSQPRAAPGAADP